MRRVHAARVPVIVRTPWLYFGERLAFFDSARYSSAPCSSTVLMPLPPGCAGRRRSRLAWCLRWMATHLLGHHAGRQPKPEAEEVRGSQYGSSTRGGPARADVEDRHRGDRDVRHHDGEEHDHLPPVAWTRPWAASPRGWPRPTRIRSFDTFKPSQRRTRDCNGTRSGARQELPPAGRVIHHFCARFARNRSSRGPG